MKIFIFLLLLCTYETICLKNQVIPKENGACGVPKGGLMVQRITPSTTATMGLYWSESEPNNTLTYVNPLNASVYCWKYESGKTEGIQINELIGKAMTFVYPREGKKGKEFIIAAGNKLYNITIDKNGNDKPYKITKLMEIGKDNIACGTTDEKGQLIVGASFGKLYIIKKGGYPAVLHEDVGDKVYDMAFSDKCNYLYITDGKCIKRYNYSVDDGSLDKGSKKIVFDLSKHYKNNWNVKITAIAVDKKGQIWMATCTGSVLQYNTQESLLVQAIDMPVDKLTSIAFGGYRNKNLLVGSKVYFDELKKGAPRKFSAGSIFAITGTSVTGNPGVPIKI